MRIRRFRRLNHFIVAGLLTIGAAAVAEASFTPPSPVTFNAAAYADRASRANTTGLSSLSSYVSPAACPVKANLFSQDVAYSVPLLSLIGRTAMNLNLTLNYNSKVWIKSGSTMYFDGEQGWPSPGWRLGFGRIDGVYSGPDGYNHYYYIAPDGGVHNLRYNSSDSLYESIDSTFMDFNDSTGVLRMKDGTQISFTLEGGTGGYLLPTQVKDRNGNYITISYTSTSQQIYSIVDTVGRTVSFSYNSDGTLASISKSGFGGASRSWTFGYTSLTLSYSFASSLTVNAPTSVKVLSSITFPNSTAQTYSYNGYGQLTEVDVKSTTSTVRGKILVAWESAPGGGWTTPPTPASVGNNDGTTTNTWSLSFGSYTTTVTDPNGTATTTTFVNDSGNWDDGLPSQQQIGSTALKTTANTWGADASSLNPRLTQVLYTLNDTGQESEIQTDYTTYNNPSELREYDYGSGAPGTLIRSTDYTYVTGSNYTAAHILNLRATAIVYNGSSSSGTPASNVSYGYDGYSLTSATGASNHDDSNYGTGFAYRGLLTSISQYTDPVTPANLVTHTEHYDMLGNMLNASADCCVHQQINFSTTTQYSQPDSVVSGYSGTTTTTSATYDAYTGLIASSTDPSSQTTSYNYDVMDRLTSTERPDSTVISTSYDDSSANPGMTVTTPITSTTNVKNTTTFDGLGRPIRATVLDTSNTVYSKVDTQYDGLGQTTQTSLPYTGSSPSYWTQNSYSATGQLTQMIPADGSSSSNNLAFSYSGNSYTSTDPTGKQSKTVTDAIGRTSATYMPDPSSGNSLTIANTNTFDALNNVTQTSQGSQTLTYTYDGFGRMTSSTTPAAGTVSNQYNPYGRVTQRTDARGVVTSYTYDNLNRLTQISYDVSGATGVPATPTVSYSYGTSSSSYNNGRLIQMTDGLGTESYTYDQLGRVTEVQKVIDNVKYTTDYTYNLANQIVTMTYPSGRVVKNYYDGIGRATGVQNNSNSAYYASSIGYDTANDITGFTYGNGVAASYGYTPQRLLLSSISYTEGSTTLLGLSYGYSQSGGNDAEITSITDSTASGRSASYTYNADGALTAASTTGSTGYPAWGLSWTYDQYGNRTAQVITAGSAYSSSPTVSSTTNHITSVGGSSYTYDASGNLTQDDLFKYKLDGENRVVEVDYISGTPLAYYSYDGKSNRTVKVVDGGRTFFLYGAGSKVISVFDDAASNTYTSGTTPGSAVDDYYATLLYQHKDQLTTRLTTDNSGVLASYQGHFPFGETWYEGGTADPSLQQRFATFMKDYETDSAMLHYAMSEFYSARNGEFQTLAPGRPGITQPVNPYANQNPVGPTTDPGNSGPNPNRPVPAIMTDGGGGSPFGSGCLFSDDPASCGGYGFGYLPALGNSNPFAAITDALQGLLTMLTDVIMRPANDTDDQGNPRTYSPDQFTKIANAIMALNDPSSFLNKITYAPAQTDYKDRTEFLIAVEKWETTVLQTPPQGPFNPIGPGGFVGTCNLQMQQGNNCSYSCTGNGPFRSYTSTVDAITKACSVSNTGLCPTQIKVKGLTQDTATVAACTNF